MTLLVVGLMAATWRVTRLLVRDEFPPIRAVREWVIRTWGLVDQAGHITGGRRWGGLGYSMAYLWTCQWCTSVWVGAALVAVADWRGDVALPWLVWALAASFTGVMTWVEDAAEQRWELHRVEVAKARIDRLIP